MRVFPRSDKNSFMSLLYYEFVVVVPHYDHTLFPLASAVVGIKLVLSVCLSVSALPAELFDYGP